MKFNVSKKELPTSNPFVLMDVNNIIQMMDKLSKQVQPKTEPIMISITVLAVN